MYQTSYVYKRHYVSRYSFTSIGKKSIEKVVDFGDTGIKNTFNLAFGDLQPDGSVDDMINSNNGDIVKVLATVISILKEFIALHPKANVTFLGSTKERTKLYTRILKTYYSTFSAEFQVLAFVNTDKGIDQVEFDPSGSLEYVLFLIKKID
jgi:hypothetical protein